ncbi:MAG: hypothetical protein E2O41_07415 [Nitrospina sp.]|nr:MAG: hypothetical protein E2O41_07415 [Nitrospina sp.]
MMRSIHPIKILTQLKTRTLRARMIFLLMGIFLIGGIAAVEGTETHPVDYDSMQALEMAERALVDTLYYNFSDWVPRFQKRIDRLQALPQNIPNQLELMKFYFYMAGLNGELTHVLAFTSEFFVDSVKQKFSEYNEKAKSLAQALLDNPRITRQNRAEAYFYLGMAEGYLAMMQYGEGRFLSALINGLEADNHLEDTLKLDPRHADAHVGLGVYRYGNTRLGGLGNFIMQGGADLRQVGLTHIETALNYEIISRPLALKTLIWFYISEQINPDNAELPNDHPLSPYASRARAHFYLDEYERRYFREAEANGFVGNKGLALMMAIQHVLDRQYVEARDQFKKALKITRYLIEVQGMQINPKYGETLRAGIKFSDLMVLTELEGKVDPESQVCRDVKEQIAFVDNGGTMINYESSKIRREIQDVFYQRLKGAAKKHHC